MVKYDVCFVREGEMIYQPQDNKNRQLGTGSGALGTENWVEKPSNWIEGISSRTEFPRLPNIEFGRCQLGS